MGKLVALFRIRTYIYTYIATVLAVVSFSNFMVQLFGQTIPSTVLAFFREAGVAVVLGAVFVFVFLWFLKARPRNRPQNYSVVPFDVFGSESSISGIRTEFHTHDVAWSYMRQYKEAYPLYNFALVSDVPGSPKRTIFRYI
ncbi:conserved hypothetical protein [Cenarchaeum symbiosum A]|uniref:Uncharacterized protein n=1 Tax=Cenarchaeum symbiosum (strain A) TaxID=414004 RepID=A0RWD7_CENSY|nr:conserved hypothetical protein [Cenarchaeum symbiosum A]